MLSRINAPENTGAEQVYIKDASFPAPFHAGLEYSSPARGTWNIVHTGMLIPESHQIFVCAYGCLRGVVLTAAEMNALDRYSSISISEKQVLDGGMEQLMIDGVKDIIEKLSYRPRAILLFISCQHFFLAYDQQYVFDTLSDMFPDIRFIDCYMIPTLRKSGITPDQKMRIQMHMAWKKPEVKNKNQINLIGSNLPLYAHAELIGWLKENGITLRQIHDCKDYDDYLSMAASSFNIYYEPLVHMAAEDFVQLKDIIPRNRDCVKALVDDGQRVPVSGDFLFIAVLWGRLFRNQLPDPRACRNDPFDFIGPADRIDHRRLLQCIKRTAVCFFADFFTCPQIMNQRCCLQKAAGNIFFQEKIIKSVHWSAPLLRHLIII